MVISVEHGGLVTIDNKMGIDINIMYYEVRPDGHYESSALLLGTVPTGEIVTLKQEMLLNGIGYYQKIIIKAVSTSGYVVWQHS